MGDKFENNREHYACRSNIQNLIKKWNTLQVCYQSYNGTCQGDGDSSKTIPDDIQAQLKSSQKKQLRVKDLNVNTILTGGGCQ